MVHELFLHIGVLHAGDFDELISTVTAPPTRALASVSSSPSASPMAPFWLYVKVFPSQPIVLNCGCTLKNAAEGNSPGCARRGTLNGGGCPEGNGGHQEQHCSFHFNGKGYRIDDVKYIGATLKLNSCLMPASHKKAPSIPRRGFLNFMLIRHYDFLAMTLKAN